MTGASRFQPTVGKCDAKLSKHKLSKQERQTKPRVIVLKWGLRIFFHFIDLVLIFELGSHFVAQANLHSIPELRSLFCLNLPRRQGCVQARVTVPSNTVLLQFSHAHH